MKWSRAGTDGGILKGLQISLLRAIVLLATTCGAQQPPAEIPLQIPNPHYIVVTESTVVDAPVEKVWARVGGFCDINEWMNSPEWEDCKYLHGNGGPASVRSIVNEVLVGQTQYSFEKMLRNMKKLAEGGTLTSDDKQAPVEF